MMVMKHFFNMRIVLAAEVMLLLAGVPWLIAVVRDRELMIAALWAGGIAMGLYLFIKRRRQPPAPADGAGRTGWRAVLVRFAVLAPLILLGAWLWAPGDFLSFPRESPQRWLMVMALYPLLSVWPQEVIYRAYIHERYAPLWGTGMRYVIASAVSFGYMHIIFLNAPAVIMTMILGFILARDYARHRSLWLVCGEHALYGCLIFTSGLGRYFYSGAAWG